MNTVLLFSPGPAEIIIILAVVVLLFGGRKIPELMKGIGQGIKEFKKASNPKDKNDEDDTFDPKKLNSNND